MSAYSTLPRPISIEASKYRVETAPQDLQALLNLVRNSKLGPRTFENSQANGQYGLTYEWMSQAKSYWETSFDWGKVEDHINSYPSFISKIVDDDGSTYSIHFVGLFSKRKDAVPLMCIHGWPGSFLEFLGILSALRNKYAPEELPYHIIIPSLPGYAFSDTPPLDKNWTLQDSARLLHKLMVGLGFEDGYSLQGGDIGSYTARIMARHYESCKALHLNFCVMTCPDELNGASLEPYERTGLERGDDFAKFGTAYALEHCTRTATIGFVLSSSPLALLAWIGEKYLTWTDATPSMDEILSSVTLYWLTETFARAIYPYRQELIEEPRNDKTDAECCDVFRQGPQRYMIHPDPNYYCSKPMGYSWFPYEIAPVPKSWAATTGNLVWFKNHQKGGHFAALEQPLALLEDIENFLKEVWV
ncbi:Alpha/Beta hydrolase protein [Dactylonectria macrodidyma]|uniref:Alpha/Beta hydrolase protein n=1 Tax=Dactylonectria macrodidyma TaxID=307937 RepID=A0A9P9IUH1_9HYPO|nr:Alpha/Beta hydrolase protein [Dactylonectria macrodidyma]